MKRARTPRWIPLLALCAAVALPVAADGNAPPSDRAEAPVSTTTATADQTRQAAWSALLARYVKPGDDGLNRFDYGALQANEADRAALQRYIAGFATLDIDALSRDEAFAAWVNLYNALTVEHILGRYPLGSIRDGYFVGPWKSVKTMADGREVSLHEIEHDILRKQWDDPRVHYAVNCASIGCPNLRPTAWTGATLEADLDAAARAYVNHPRGVSVLSNGLSVSRIYKWFREDFGGTNAGVLEHLKKYAEPELRAAIDATPRIRKHAYDWALNDIESESQ